ncbi:MAG TPA: SemiSWEET transporter [Dehalococcoidia bacterium]|nr:SemiSWEET transporter [Dehalococcoidia bacterium]
MNDIAWYVVGAAAAVLTTFGFVPQVVKMWRTKSVKDISPLTFVQFIAGVSLWAVYGTHLKDPVIIAANLVAVLILFLGLFFYFKYFKRESR